MITLMAVLSKGRKFPHQSIRSVPAAAERRGSRSKGRQQGDLSSENAVYAPSNHVLGREDSLSGPHIYKSVFEPGLSVNRVGLGLVLTKIEVQ